MEESAPLSSTETVERVPNVEPLDLEEPPIKIIPFGVALPSFLTMDREKGIVGSIVVMGKKSAMLWVGWGLLDDNTANSTSSSFGTGTPTMGQLVVAMPRTNYKGAFATGSKEASCSQLVGSASSEDQMLANQMASRLSSRSGMAIYVSCQLSFIASREDGPEADMLSQRAAGLAEKHVWKILQDEIS